jgi:ketosteroid isomerase-like protein
MERLAAMALLDRLHKAQAAFYAGGPSDPVRALLTDDVEWHVPGASEVAGSYYGFTAVMDYFAKRRDIARGTFRMYPGEVMVGEGHVAVLTDGSAVVDGVERSWSTVGLYRIRGTRIAACWLLPLDPLALDQAWGANARDA